MGVHGETSAQDVCHTCAPRWRSVSLGWLSLLLALRRQPGLPDTWVFSKQRSRRLVRALTKLAVRRRYHDLDEKSIPRARAEAIESRWPVCLDFGDSRQARGAVSRSTSN